MPFDLIGFGEATPGANGNLAAFKLDDMYPSVTDYIKIQKKATKLLGISCYAESTLARTKLEQVGMPLDYAFEKGGLNSGVSPSLAYTDLRGRPLPLIAGENLSCSVINASDEAHNIYIMIGDGKITRAMLDSINPTHRITAYGDTAGVAYTWVNIPLTWNQSLPVGRYAVVGMNAGYYKSGGAKPAAARLVFHEPHSAAWRPGVIANKVAAAHIGDQVGDWFEPNLWPLMANINFPNDNMPTVEFNCGEAASDEDIELLLQKIG